MSNSKTKKIIFILFIILLSTTILSQDFGIALKYNTDLEGSYESYNSFSVSGLFPFYNGIFETGPSIGLIYSELPIYTTNPEKMDYSDRAYIQKFFFGGTIRFFLFGEKYAPYIGIKGAILFDNPFENNKTTSHPGLNNFKTKNDYLFSIIGGFKINFKAITVILEAEYQHRKLLVQYDDYNFNGEKNANHSYNMEINSLIGGIGLQFNF